MTITAAQDEFIQQHAEHGTLTPQQAAQLLELAEQGDTGTKPELDAKPDATPAAGEANPDGVKDQTKEESKPAAAADGDLDEPKDPSKTVIQAKDGVHTIPYEKLVAARDGEKQWKAKAEQAESAHAAALKELEGLRAQAQQRVDAGQAPTAVDNQVAAAQAAIDKGVDPAIFGDFSEEAMARGIQQLVDAQVAARVAEVVNAKVGEALKPFQQSQAANDTQAHYQAIYKAHPDADSIFESKELQDWIAKQPKFAQPGYRDVLTGGDTGAVIELFDTFKASSGRAPAQADTAPAGDVKAQAKAAAQAAPTPVPVSLSDLPGGRPSGLSADEQLAGLSGPDMSERMASMTPAQIEAFLNRQL
jgi:hypothetical protein